MTEDFNKIEELSKKLDALLSMHNNVSVEIDNLRVEIIRLKVAQKQRFPDQTLESSIEKPSNPVNEGLEDIHEGFDEDIVESTEINENITEIQKETQAVFEEEQVKVPKQKFDIEKLIGENLINKIGILILIIGVAVGAKYSIDENLISPIGRIVLGYMAGVVLLGLGMWLKKKYLNFSAVLVSGAMAIFYFITFFAFYFYQLIGQEVAFGLMVLFTIFTVLAALNYDKQIIAQLGLVGAISVPFLLSNDSGNALILFSYIAIINLGIAFISLKKNWKLLFYSSFVFTWLVYFTWIVFEYKEKDHFILALSFLALYFILFYIIFIAYKFLNLKKYNIGDIIILLLNSLIFFTLGYFILSGHNIGDQLLGIFAVANGVIHFTAATIINKRKLADRNLFYLIVGLVLVCLTLAIPIQLDGHWVTIMWSLEAVIIFWIGRSKQVAFYEHISLALLAIAGMSLVQDWESGYNSLASIEYSPSRVKANSITLLFNTLFVTSAISSICIGFMFWIQNKVSWKSITKVDKSILKILDYLIPIALILVIYFALRLELMHYFSQLYAGSFIDSGGTDSSFYSNIYNVDIKHRANVWLINYTLIFFSLLSVVILKKAKDVKVNWALLLVNILVIGSFLIQGLYELSILRDHFIGQNQAEYFNIDNSFIWLRYLSITCLALLIYCSILLFKKSTNTHLIFVIGESLFYLIVLWVSTSELFQWLAFTERSEAYGLALSIYWGVFSVAIIAFGMWKKKKHLRILGIAIFAITLAKLFFYDLSNLTTVAKTIVMISLGALLLLTSFLYNKYTIDDEEKN